MNLIFYHILSIVEFLVVILIGIAAISFLLYFLSNKFNDKFINVYGFFSSMDDSSLIMLSSAILKEITLIFCIIKLNDFSILYLCIFLIFCLIYALFSFKISVFIKEMLVGITECLIIFLLNLLSSFLVDVRFSTIIVCYIWILSGVLITCSIYFFARNLSTILKRDKHIRRNLNVK